MYCIIKNTFETNELIDMLRKKTQRIIDMILGLFHSNQMSLVHCYNN